METDFEFVFNVSFLAAECYDLGRIAYTRKDYYHTLLWMQEALNSVEKEGNNATVNKVDILDHLAYATSQVKQIIFYEFVF